MRYSVIEQAIAYTGRELRQGWVCENTGLEGDAGVAFVGHCRVENEDLVDRDDAQAGAFIHSELMAHLIVEHPSCNLQTAVLRQRMLVCLLCEMLRERDLAVRRDGDDVYIDRRKLTVSIAAPAPGSALIHLGINVRPEGAPVPAIGLDELGVEAMPLLGGLLERYARELDSCKHAEEKVREVP